VQIAFVVPVYALASPPPGAGSSSTAPARPQATCSLQRQRRDPRVFGSPGKPSAWLLAGGWWLVALPWQGTLPSSVFGELEANPQLNCYRWHWLVASAPTAKT
jgi:hypothetical protein